MTASWVAGCGSPTPQPNAGPVPVEADGLHNAFRLSDRLYSGSSPDGEVGFASLRKLGVKTVILVDGAPPDVRLAERYGLPFVDQKQLMPVGREYFEDVCHFTPRGCSRFVQNMLDGVDFKRLLARGAVVE